MDNLKGRGNAVEIPTTAMAWTQISTEDCHGHGNPRSPADVEVLRPVATKRSSSFRSSAKVHQLDFVRTESLHSAPGSAVAPSDPCSLAAENAEDSWRVLCRRMVESRIFDATIYSCIALNTIAIALNDVYAQRSGTKLDKFFDFTDWFVLIVFTVEMLLKMYAWGLGWQAEQRGEANDLASTSSTWFSDEKVAGYFSSKWNSFDAIVVVVSWITTPLVYAVDVSENAARFVRAVRTARPLRALRSFEGTQDVLLTFPQAIPAMRDSIQLLCFIFVVFSILGVNLFGVEGTFHGRCVVDKENSFGTKGMLQKERDDEVLCGHMGCGEGFRCSCKPLVFANGTVQPEPWAFFEPETLDRGCLDLEPIRPWINSKDGAAPRCPDYGFTCFDNFPIAFLTCFKIITLDNWSRTMWWAQDALHPNSWIYFLSLIFLVSFNVVNLYVAGISSSYAKVRELRLRKKNRQRKRFSLGENEKGKEEIEEPSLYVKICQKLRPERKKLKRLSYACRRFVTYPLEIDETGHLVQEDILMLAAERHVEVHFGPKLGQWRIVPLACAIVDDDKRQQSGLFYTGTSDLSVDPERQDLRDVLLRIPKERVIEAQSRGSARAAWVDLGILICIFANTVTLAIAYYDGSPVSTDTGFLPEDHCCNRECTWRDPELCPRSIIPMPMELKSLLDSAEIVFCIIFSLEMVIKVISAEGLLAYVLENIPSNFFDAFVVVVSDAMLIASIFIQHNVNITVLRLLRLLRVFRLVSGFRRLHSLLGKSLKALESISYVLFVLVFWHVIGSLLAMQLFSCDVRNEQDCQMINGTCPKGCSDLVGSPPRCVFNQDEMFEHCPWDQDINFNTFLDGVVALLFVTTGETWSEIMGKGMRSYPMALPGVLFFVIFHVISAFFLYNLFIGVIVQEFELTERQKEGMQLGMLRVRVLKEMKMMRVRHWNNAEAAALGLPVEDEIENEGNVPGLFFESIEGKRIEYDDDTPIFFGMMRPPTPNAQFPDDPKNVRAYVRIILLNVWFDRLILLTILTSAATLALESPIREYSMLDPDISLQAEYGYLSIFMLEFVLKVLDRGLCWESKRAYFRSAWNCLDFVILTFQLIDVLQVANLSTVRIFRMLRPLRLLNKVKSLQLLLLAIQACAVDVMNVLLLWLFAFIIFAIMGVSFFSGKLMACNDGDFVGAHLNPSESPGSLIGWRENCVGNFYTATNDRGEAYVSESMETLIAMPRVWANPADSATDLGFSFDNFGKAFQTLFEVASFEQWTSVVFVLQATTKVGQQPVAKNSALNVLYLHAWVVLSCFFLLQLVIGILIDAINQKSGKSLLTTLQRNFMQIEATIFKLKPFAHQQLPASNLQAGVWRLVNSPKFQNAIISVIITNIVILALEGYDSPPNLLLTVQILDYMFVVIYCLEILMKLFAYGLSFFRDVWNVFDFSVVLASIIEVNLGSASGLTAVRAIRVLRVIRTIRLVRHAASLRLIITSLARTLPHIMSALVLLMLCTFLFAVLGVQLFSGVKAGFGVHRRNNFYNTFNACLLLLRVITGEDWQVVLRDCGIQYPLCTTDQMARMALNDPYAKGDCGNDLVAYLYFDSFYTIGNSILLNLFIAVLLENFITLQSSFLLSDKHWESYQRVWRGIDKLGRGKISVSKFRELVEKLHHDNNPLGTCARTSEMKMRCVRVEVMENSKDGELAFQDVAMTLAMHVVGSHGLEYSDMLKRQERLTYFAYIATISKMTVLLRSARDKTFRESGLKRRDDESLLEHLIAEEMKCHLESESIRARVGRPFSQASGGVQPSLVEICLASLPESDLERAMLDLESMLSNVSTDRYVANIRSALAQLALCRSQRPPVWPREQPGWRALTEKDRRGVFKESKSL